MKEQPTVRTSAETRKLAAIMFTDIVGFSRQMGTDEARTLRVLTVHASLGHVTASLRQVTTQDLF